MKPITPGQRKSYFCNARRLGINRSRWLLKRMTGHTSTKQVSCWQMSFVIQEQKRLISQEVPGTHTPPQDGSVIQLIAVTQREAITALRGKLSLDKEGFQTMCRRAIKKVGPETYQEGEIVTSLLAHALTHRHRARLKRQ